MSLFSKNLQKFLIFFFTSISVMVIILGIIRTKKAPIIADVAVPPIPATPPFETAGTSTTAVAASGARTFTGTSYQTPWGNAIASITVKDGKIIAATMPKVPNSPPSTYAEPFLIDQAIKAGSANIQGVSGATYTSLAFKSSLENALSQAKNQGQTVTGGTPSLTSGGAALKPSVPRRYRREDDEFDD